MNFAFFFMLNSSKICIILLNRAHIRPKKYKFTFNTNILYLINLSLNQIWPKAINKGLSCWLIINSCELALKIQRRALYRDNCFSPFILSHNVGLLRCGFFSICGFAAMQKGIFVSCIAGNSGPSNTTLSNEAPWLLTVGASTIDLKIVAIAKLGNGELDGESVFQLISSKQSFEAFASFFLVF